MNIIFIGIFIYGILDHNNLIKGSFLGLNMNPKLKSTPFKIGLTFMCVLCIFVTITIGFWEWFQASPKPIYDIPDLAEKIGLAQAMTAALSEATDIPVSVDDIDIGPVSPGENIPIANSLAESLESASKLAEALNFQK